MKIIFLNRYFYPDHSATSQMLSDLAFYLAEHQHEIHVITSRQIYDDPRAKLAPLEIFKSITIHRVWTSSFGRHFLPGRLVDYLSFYLCCCGCLFRICRKGDMVVAKTDPPMLSDTVAFVTRLRKAVLVTWLQDLFPEVATALNMRGFNKFTASLLQWLRNRSLHRAVTNVVVGEEMQSRLVREHIPAEKIRVIHNWADGELIKPLARTNNPLVREWGLQDKFIVGYSGNLGRGHDYEVILEAARKLKPHKQIVFLFIGGGAGIEKLKSVQQHDDLDNVVYQNYQRRETLTFSLGVSDIHLITLRPEMTGLMVPSKFYGVAAAGKPVLFVGTEECEIARIIREAQCGEIIKPGDGTGLADKILILQQSPSLLMEMGRRARKVFDEKFTSVHAFRQWELLLEKVISRR